MSLVPEEHQSTNCSYTQRFPILHPRKPSRPVSPLPPIIMEKERNPCDESEEFYVKLEKKVLRIYRRLFIEGKSDISDIENDHTDVSTSSEKRPSAANNEDEVRKSKISKITGNSSSTEASPIGTLDTNRASNSLNSCLADATEDIETRASPLSHYSEEADADMVYEYDADLEEEVEELEDNDVAMPENNDDVSDNQHNTSDEIEVMRAEPLRPSVISLHNQDHTDSSNDHTDSSNDNHVINEESRPLEEHTDSASDENDPETMEFDANHDSEENVFDRFRKNSTTSSSSDGSFICYNDASTQTPLDHETVTRNILKDIFVGTPKVFKLCSCSNHFCNDE